MKKIISILFLITIGYSSFAQFPIKQTIGAPQTIIQARGGLGADSGFVQASYPDTITANRGFLKNIQGITIRVKDTLFTRSTDLTKWVAAGTPVDTINLITTHTYGDNRYVQIQTYPPLASLSGGGNYELKSAGTTPFTLSWTATRQAAGTGVFATANLTSIVVATVSQTFSNPAAGGTVSGTQGVTVTNNTNTTYNNVVTTADGKTVTASTTFTWLPNRYWGYSTGTPVSADLLAALGGGQELSNSIAKGAFNIVISGTTKKVFYAYPSNEGALSSIIISGLESIGAFVQSTISVTNASGYVQNYFVYTSNNTYSNVTVAFNSTN